MVTKYLAVFGTNGEDLSQNVTEHLSAGWVLYGNPYTVNGYHYQAMTWSE